MATNIGRKATLEISDDGIAYTKLGKMTSIGKAFSTDMADETNNDSDGWKEEQPSDSQMTLDGSGKFDEADSGQTAASLASIGKLKKFWRFRPGGTAVGGVEYTFSGHIPDFNVDTETSSVEDLSVTVNSTGVVTRGIQ
jgi:hypothetical protein